MRHLLIWLPCRPPPAGCHPQNLPSLLRRTLSCWERSLSSERYMYAPLSATNNIQHLKLTHWQGLTAMSIMHLVAQRRSTPGSSTHRLSK